MLSILLFVYSRKAFISSEFQILKNFTSFKFLVSTLICIDTEKGYVLYERWFFANCDILILLLFLFSVE